MDKNNIDTLVNVLRSLSILFERGRDDGDEEFVHSRRLVIEKYRINLNFYYNSVAIVVSYDSNFNVFFIACGEEKEADIEVVKRMLSIIDLPPNLLIQKLNQIGINEL